MLSAEESTTNGSSLEAVDNTEATNGSSLEAVDNTEATNGSSLEAIDNTEDLDETGTSSENNENALIDDNSSSNAEGNQIQVDENELIREGEALLEQGKHLLAANDYSLAANILLSAYFKFCHVYGNMANECGDAYYYYGCALLESAVAGKQTLRVPRKENSTVKPDISVEETTNGSELQTDQPGNDSSSGVVQTENGTTDKETMVTVDKLSDGQLAREMFELAKDIYTRQNNEKMLINVYSKLTTTDMFLSNYKSAIVNGKKCLAFHEEQLNPVERDVADILFKLGTACVLSNEYYTAVKHFTSSGVVYDKLIRRLLRSAKSYNDTDGSDPVLNEIYNEVNEIRILVQNTKDNICEAEELIRESMKSEAANGVGNKAIKNSDGSSYGGLPVSTDPETRASIISNLLKRKRKLLVNNGNEEKKPRLDEA